MIVNERTYTDLRAKLPQGLLLYGEPGMGKTSITKRFNEECNLPSYTVRNNKSAEWFIDAIDELFQEAKQNAPSIVLLGDLENLQKKVKDDEMPKNM